jgi:hypothetical protein
MASSETANKESIPHIHILPDDILREIFTFTLSNYAPAYETPIQYVLGTVCRRWREVILHSPLLWTDIHAPLNGIYDPFVFFERSSPALIDVSISPPPKPYLTTSRKSDLEFYSRILDTISNNLPRLRRFFVVVDDFEQLHCLFTSWTNREVPNLRKLNVECGDYYQGILATFLNNGKSLCSTKVPGLQFGPFPILPNMTSLEFAYIEPNVDELQVLFSQFPALETLIIGTLGQPEEPSSNSVPYGLEIEAPSLKSLAIGLNDEHNEFCKCVLPYFPVKNLEYLEISLIGTVFADQHTQSILSRFKDCTCLRNVRIHNPPPLAENMFFLPSGPGTIDLEFICCPGLGCFLLDPSNMNAKSVTLDLTAVPGDSFVDTVYNFLRDHSTLQHPISLRCTCTEEVAAFWMSTKTKFSLQEDPLSPGFLDSYVKDHEHYAMVGSDDQSEFDADASWDDYEDDFEDGYDEDNGSDVSL